MSEVLEASDCEFISHCPRYRNIVPGMESYCKTKQHEDCIGRKVMIGSGPVKNHLELYSMIRQFTQSQLTQAQL